MQCDYRAASREMHSWSLRLSLASSLSKSIATLPSKTPQVDKCNRPRAEWDCDGKARCVLDGCNVKEVPEQTFFREP